METIYKVGDKIKFEEGTKATDHGTIMCLNYLGIKGCHMVCPSYTTDGWPWYTIWEKNMTFIERSYEWQEK